MKTNILMMGLTPPLEGGSERHIYELSSRLDNCKVFTQKGTICKKSVEVSLPKNSEFIRNVTFFFKAFIYSLYLALKPRREHDLVHIHENLLYFCVPILRLRYRVVVTVHGIKGFKFYDNKFYWLFFRQPLKFANNLIAVNKADRKIFNRYFKKDKSVYFPNGVDGSIYNGIKVKVQKKISFIGRVNEQKGMIYLLEAFREFSRKFPDYRLEIIGDVNDYARELQKEFKDLKIDWEGFMSDRKKIATHLSGATCIALPSLWEGLPLVLFESLASERPLVVTDIPAYTSVIKDEAIFCKVKDGKDLAKQLEYLVKNRKEGDKIGQKGLVLARKYDWNNIADKLGMFYDGVYNEKKHGY